MVTWVPPSLAFQSDTFTITWYGIILSGAVLVGYVMVVLLTRLHDKKRGTNYERHIDPLFWWSFVPALLGARILFIAYHPSYFSSYPAEMIAVWHGGLVWHGALIGCLAGSALYCAWKKIPWLALADIAAPALALGQAIGRWGNYFNQENYGLPTDMPWGIIIEPQNRVSGFEQFVSFHPAFLYESLWDIALFIFLWKIIRQKVLRTSPSAGTPGMIFAFYVIVYSVGRFAIELLRIDTVPVLWGLRAPQWISLGFIMIGILVIYGVLHKRKKMIH